MYFAYDKITSYNMANLNTCYLFKTREWVHIFLIFMTNFV